jgi:hypothetical protein
MKHRIAMEVREYIDSANPMEYKIFLQELFPVFYDILRNGQPVFQDTIEHVSSCLF